MRYLKYAVIVTTSMLICLILIPHSDFNQAKETDPIKIGFLGEYTGSFAGKGQQIEKGIKLRLDEVGWKVAGRKIQVIIEDAQSTVEGSLDKARKVVGFDKVDVVFGPLKKESLLAVAPYCSSQGVPLLSAGVGAPADVAKNATLFAMEGSELGLATGLGRYAYEKLGYKTAGCLSHDFRFGHTITESLTIGFKEKGGAILKEVYMPLGTMDFTTYLTTMGRPDALCVFLIGAPDALRFYRQYRELGLNLPVLAPEAGAIQQVMQELSNDIVGIIGCVTYLDSIDTKANKQFVKDFTKKYQEAPTANEVRGYTNTSVFLKAVEATGGDTTPAKIIKALEKTKIDLPEGPVEIGPDRVAKRLVYIFKCVKKGDKVAWEIVDQFVNVQPKK